MQVHIDAGHGGKDPGAVSRVRQWLKDRLFSKEKDVVLDVAKRVGYYLKKRGVTVTFDRTGDVYHTPTSKGKLAKRKNPDVFVSIHADSSLSPKAKGASVLYKGTKDKSLATHIYKYLSAVSPVSDRGIKRRTDLAVLNWTDTRKTASSLVEIGFISNVEAEKRFRDYKYRDRIAKAIADGVFAQLGIKPYKLFGVRIEPLKEWQVNKVKKDLAAMNLKIDVKEV